MTIDPGPFSLRILAAAVAIGMAGVGALLGAAVFSTPESAPVARAAAASAPAPDAPRSATTSETRLFFSNNDQRVQVLIRNGQMDVRVNGQPVGEDRIEREGGDVRILDEQGEPIVTLRRLPGGGWAIGDSATLTLQGDDARLLLPDFTGVDPLLDLQRLRSDLERLRQRLKFDFQPFSVFGEGDDEPRLLRFDNGFMGDFQRRMEEFQRRMSDFGRRMGQIGQRIAQVTREDAGDAFAAKARDAFESSLESASSLGDSALRAIRAAFEAALKGALESASWNYDSDAGAVALASSPMALLQNLTRRFEAALAADDADLPQRARQAAQTALQSASQALSGASATLSDDARGRIEALFEEMRSLGREMAPSQDDSNLPVEKGAKKVSA